MPITYLSSRSHNPIPEPEQMSIGQAVYYCVIGFVFSWGLVALVFALSNLVWWF